MSVLEAHANAQTVGQWLSGLQAAGEAGRLGKAGSRLIRLMSQEPHFASYATVGELAARAGLHASSVTRVAQALGFDGWPALRTELRELYILSPLEVKPSRYDATATSGTAHAIEAIRVLDEPSAQDAIVRIAQAIQASGRTLVIGSGLAAVPGVVLSHLGVVAGIDIRVSMESPTAQLALVSNLSEGDCVVGINVWRMTRSLYEAMNAAKAQGVATCLVTDARGSRLVDVVDHLLYVPTATSEVTPSVTAMTLAAEMIIQRASGGGAVAHARTVEALWHRADLMDEHD